MEQAILFSSRNHQWSWLSNMAIDPFLDQNGTEWRSVEHFYQAAKAINNRDRDQIRMAASPFDAKRLGGRLANCRKDWKTYRVTAMRRALALRFHAGAPSSERLLKTGDQALVHDTPWGRTGDPFWGNGRDGRGRNLLGEMLMEQRDALRTAPATASAASATAAS